MSTSRAVSSTLTTIRSQRKKATPGGLENTLKWLNKEPQPILDNIRGLSLTYGIRNTHFGARHFAKEDLPRISYVNHNLRVFVDRKHQENEKEPIKAMISVELGNGSVKDIDIGEKTSGTILQELLALDRSAQAKAS